MKSKFRKGLIKHLNEVWPNANQELYRWTTGGIVSSNPDFRVCRIAPSIDNKSWVYVSIGASEYLNRKGEHLEFSITSPFDDQGHIETLAMVAHFHSDPSLRLELGSVMEIGEGWVEGSKCDHLLVSLPYFQGPEFECCTISNHLIRILWLVPITKREFTFLQKHGLEALESKFEINQVRITDPYRDSII